MAEENEKQEEASKPAEKPEKSVEMDSSKQWIKCTNCGCLIHPTDFECPTCGKKYWKNFGTAHNSRADGRNCGICPNRYVGFEACRAQIMDHIGRSRSIWHSASLKRDRYRNTYGSKCRRRKLHNARCSGTDGRICTTGIGVHGSENCNQYGS